MHEAEAWEEVSVVAPEVGKELRIFVEPQELTDELDGEHFRIPERRWGGSSAPSEAPEVGDTVVYEAEDGDDEGVKIRKKTSSTSLRCYWSTPSVGRYYLWFKPSKKRAHGVS
jgi:hypothetical protein